MDSYVDIRSLLGALYLLATLARAHLFPRRKSVIKRKPVKTERIKKRRGVLV